MDQMKSCDKKPNFTIVRKVLIKLITSLKGINNKNIEVHINNYLVQFALIFLEV